MLQCSNQEFGFYKWQWASLTWRENNLTSIFYFSSLWLLKIRFIVSKVNSEEFEFDFLWHEFEFDANLTPLAQNPDTTASNRPELEK